MHAGETAVGTHPSRRVYPMIHEVCPKFASYEQMLQQLDD
jgi:hypothetical protein